MSKNQTISDALKALFLELGGDASKLADNQKISDYIDDLATVLTSAPEEFDITLTHDDDNGYAIDKTHEEIEEAIATGKTIYLIPAFNNFDMDNNKILATVFGSYGTIGFIGTLYGGSDDFYIMGVHLSSGNIVVHYETIQQVLS